MVEPLGVVALSLTCLHGCIKGIIIISKARSYNQNVSDAQFRTNLVLHSLTTWAEEAGLTREPPTLLVNASDAPLVPQILTQLENLFTDINELRTRYGTYLQPTDEDVKFDENDDDDDNDDPVPLKGRGLRQKWAETIDAALFLKRAQAWKRLRWITLDDEKFDRLLDKAKGYVAELGRFLEQARQARMEGNLEFILRSAILNADDHRLEIISREYQDPVINHNSAISAAARLKQTRLRLNLAEPASELMTDTLTNQLTKSRSVSAGPPLQTDSASQSSPLSDMRLSMRLLTLGRAARSEPHRTLALYDRRTVLLEWKYVTSMDNMVLANRVGQVASLLHDIGPALHSLQCRGFVRDRIAKRYGYIFDLPDELNSFSRLTQSFDGIRGVQKSSVTQLKSLRQMFKESRSPSLNMRLSLAVKLLETLLNLHTSGWLHKQFRSDNILFLRRTEDPASSNQDDLSSYSIYIAGYVYSRIDGPGEMTESIQSDKEADLYRHPSLLSNARQAYRKSFDIFSVACTLLEIGLWASLSEILERHSLSKPSTKQSDNQQLFLRPPSQTRLSERAMSEPNILISDNNNNNNNNIHDTVDTTTQRDRPRTGGKSHDSLDLMALKRDLLCFHFPDHTDSRSRGEEKKPPLRPSPLDDVHRGGIMRSLESAVGKRYVAIVEELLATSVEADHDPATEHENALDVEMRARDALRAIADAV